MSHDLRTAGISLLAGLTLSSAPCLALGGVTRTYTTDADFDEGVLSNVNHTVVHDQLQLDVIPSEQALAFVVFACSDRGTIVRVNARTGAILGEYQTAPNRLAKNPSRTGIDDFGNVWVGNRAESSNNKGSVVKFGLIVGGTRVDAVGSPDANGQFLKGPFGYNTCVDRDGDGLIRTSRGLGNVLSWPNVTDGVGGADGLVQDALDECTLVYQRTSGIQIRTIAVDNNNDVWAGGYPFFPTSFDKLAGSNGAILSSFVAPGCGGNGGLVDSSGILWSESHLESAILRYDPTTSSGVCLPVINSTGSPSLPHGIAVDTNGFIWVCQFNDDEVSKYDPAGNLIAGFPVSSGGASLDRSIAVTPADNNVWVGNSAGNDVSRLDNNGNLLKVIPLPGGISPRGVSIDADGKVWVANFGSNNGMRIDPNGGLDGLGAVDLTVNLGANAGPENYRDFTGDVPLRGAGQPNGSWNVVFDSGAPNTEFGKISYTSQEPAGTSLNVEFRTANTVADLPNQPFVHATNGQQFSGVFGRLMEVRVSFIRATPQTTASPILFDLTIESIGGTTEPVCENGQRHPGSLLVYPEFDNRAGDVTLLTVTNTDQDADFIGGTNIQDGSTKVEFVYVGRYGLQGELLDCVEFNRTEFLTPNDTLSLLTRAHNPQQAQGYVYAFAKDALTNRPVVHNHLIGNTLILNGLESIQYGHNAYSFLGIGAEDQETDVDGDGIRDLNGIEYSCTADQILVPRFIGQSPTVRGDLVLINLTGGTEFLATIDFLIYNDNEEVFSAQKIFQCWLKQPLPMISNAFSQSFLANATNDAPNELFGMPSVETGWFRMDGRNAVSAAVLLDDPAFLAAYVERIGQYSASDLPFEVGSQFNGDLLPTSPLGDESP